MTRRDKCQLVGKRASQLRTRQAAESWWHLASQLEGMWQLDMPKFKHLIVAIRRATIKGRQTPE
jgi:hypothetical protein